MSFQENIIVSNSGKAINFIPSTAVAVVASDIGTPWATLAYAVTQVTTPDDTIYMQVGTHTIDATVILPIGISLRGLDSTSVITSDAITTEWSPIISLISGSLANGNQTIRNLKFDGNDATIAMALWMARRNGVVIHNCIFRDFKYMAMQWNGNGGNETTAPTNYVTGSQFYNNTISNSSAYNDGYARGALYIGGHTGMLIYNNNISQTGRTAGTNGWPIKIWANGGWTKGLKIYDNTLFKNDLTNWDFAIEGLWMFGTEIYGNTITGSIDINYISKGDYDYGLYAHNNTLGPVSNTALNYKGFVLEFNQDDVIIKYNWIRNCYMGIDYEPRATNTITNNIIAYNLFDDITNGGWGIGMWGETENQYTIGTLSVYNNVFFSKSDDKALYGVGFSGADAGTINIINNIFVNFTNYWGIFRWPIIGMK